VKHYDKQPDKPQPAPEAPKAVEPEVPPVKPLTPQEYSGLLARKIHELRFLEAEKATVDALVLREKELERAVRERDAALAAKTQALADIVQAQTQAAVESERQVSTLKATLDKAQAVADAKLAEAEKRHTGLLAEIDRVTMIKTQVDEDLHSRRKEAEREMAGRLAGLEALKVEEKSIRDRLTAALGR
jgi:hypothetical protein